jgi:hypothetical protein
MWLVLISKMLMKKVTMNLTSNKVMNKPELIKYYDYLNENKVIVFNSFYKLKNNRELKLSILLDGKNLDVLNSVEFEVNKATSSINIISDKIDKILKTDDLKLIRSTLELYADVIEDSINYIDYVEDEVRNLINT